MSLLFDRRYLLFTSPLPPSGVIDNDLRVAAGNNLREALYVFSWVWPEKENAKSRSVVVFADMRGEWFWAPVNDIDDGGKATLSNRHYAGTPIV